MLLCSCRHPPCKRCPRLQHQALLCLRPAFGSFLSRGRAGGISHCLLQGEGCSPPN